MGCTYKEQVFACLPFSRTFTTALPNLKASRKHIRSNMLTNQTATNSSSSSVNLKNSRNPTIRISWLTRPSRSHTTPETSANRCILRPRSPSGICCICREELRNGVALTHCLSQCLQVFHKECISIWLGSLRDVGRAGTCPCWYAD